MKLDRRRHRSCPAYELDIAEGLREVARQVFGNDIADDDFFMGYAHDVVLAMEKRKREGLSQDRG